MNLKWFKTLTKEQTAEMKVDLANARPALDRLSILLSEELESSLKTMVSKDNFTSSWPYLQATYLGEQRLLRDVIKLISKEK